MSLIGDLSDLYATEIGVVEGAVELAAPRAAKKTEEYGPPISYTAPGASGVTWGGTSLTSQLQLSIAESTLFSVLELIAKKTSAAKWCAYRKTVQGRNPDQERPEILPGTPARPGQNHAVDLWHRPNPFMTGKQVRQIGTWHYRSVGAAWFVVDFYDAGMTLPRAWWPVRPDRMAPNLDAATFMDGFVYTGPDGQKIELDRREVLRISNPHPINVWDSIGVVQTLMRIVGTSLTTEQWVAAFFENDATPGGFIEYPEELEEPEYQRQRRRWNEQHRGVSKAHRIGLIEMGGKFTPAAYSIKDLQFPEIRRLSRDQILEAFRIHKHNMGISEDVNRASAEAALDQLAQNELEPNLEDWAELANGPYAGLFGAAGEVVEFEYVSPRPENREADRADDTAKVTNYVALINARVDPAAAAEYLGLPELPLVEAPVEETSETSVADGQGATSATGELDETKKGDPLAVMTMAQKGYLAVEGGVLLSRVEGRRILAAGGADIDPEAWETDEPQPEPTPTVAAPQDPVVPVIEPGTDDASAGEAGDEGDPVARPRGPGGPPDGRPRAQVPDLSQMADEWQTVLDGLLAQWPAILTEQYGALERQVRDAINTDDLAALLELSTPDAGAADTLTLAMVAASVVGASAVVREAEDQDVAIGVRIPEKADLDGQASIVTGLMRAGLAVAAGQAAMRVLVPGASGEDIAEQVRAHLDSLTDAQPKQHLGGALTTAQNAGRYETLAAAPDAVYYASEQLDSATCTPCNRIDGKRYDTLAESKEDYPTSGYRKCEGLERCRGTVVAVWNEREEDDDQ